LLNARQSSSLGRALRLGAALALAVTGALLWDSPASAAEAVPAYRYYVLTVWEMGDGLPGYQVAAIAQGRDGLLWVGTQRALARFDGLRFTTVAPPQTTDAFALGVTALLVDRAGALWVGTRRCPWRSRDGRWEAFDENSGWPDGAVRGLAEDRDGALFANSEKGTVRLVGERELVCIAGSEVYGEVGGGPEVGVYARSRGMLQRWEGGEWHPVLPEGYLADEPIRGFCPLARGGGWVASGKTIREYRDGQWLRSLDRPEAIAGGSLRLHEDRQGNLWLGGNTIGLHCYRPDGELVRCGFAEGLDSRSIRCLFEDRDGNLWVGTDGSGLARLRPRLFQVYGREAGLSQPIIDSVAEVAPGEFWVGTQGSGVVRFESGRFGAPYCFPAWNLSERSWVASVLPDGREGLWIGSHMDGLFRVNGKDGRRIRLRSEWPPMTNIRALFRDAGGVLWIGSTTGLASLSDGQVRHYAAADGLPYLYVNSLAQTPDGVLWVASRSSGLFRREGDRFVPFADDPDGRLAVPVALLVDHLGALWIGSSRGRLGRLAGGQLVVFGEDRPLLDEEVGGMLEDDAGDLWLAGHGGIVRVSRASLEQVVQGHRRQPRVHRFGVADGLLSGGGRYGFFPSCCRAADGRLWFATLKGLAVVDPRDLQPRPAPAAIIEEVAIDGRPSALPSDLTQPILVPPGSRRLGVRYSASEIGTPEEVVFESRIGTRRTPGTWAPVGAERTGHWLDLPPGSWRFDVRARGRGEEWGQAAGFNVVVQPFFWQTVPCRVGVVLALLGGCALGVRVVTVRVMRLRAAAREQAAACERAAELAAINRTLDAQKQQLASQKTLLEARQVELEESLQNVKTLRGLLPICSGCKRIRDDQGYWDEVERYMATRLDVRFSHGLCPACIRRMFPELSGRDLEGCDASESPGGERPPPSQGASPPDQPTGTSA
jgi:ligand-binding sensor domain-containing protein